MTLVKVKWLGQGVEARRVPPTIDIRDRTQQNVYKYSQCTGGVVGGRVIQTSSPFIIMTNAVQLPSFIYIFMHGPGTISD